MHAIAHASITVPLLVLSGSLAVAAPQETPPPAPEEVEVEITTASPEDLASLLGRLASAEDTDDSVKIAEALAALTVHDNPELMEVGLDALKYRASKTDKRAAKELGEELGTKSKKEIAALVADREAAVQTAACHVLANVSVDDKQAKKLTRALEKAFKDKSIRSDKPLVVAGLIRTFGRRGHGDVEGDVVSELRKSSSKEITRACVRYFGNLPTKDLKNVRMLCEMLDAPEPANVDSALNPPAEYWKALWETWNWTRRDVTWALKEITGQVFRPAEGDHPSDSKKALDYVEAHREELGLD